MNKYTIIPHDWFVSALGEYVSEKTKGIVPNKTPDKIFELFSVPSFNSRKPEILKGSDIGSNKQLIEEGTVLLCKINPRINRSWVVSSHSSHTKIASTEWITFPRNDDFEPKYLEFYLKLDTFRDYLAANASGVGGSLMRVKPATLKNYIFPIAPLRQQRLIVAEIEKQFSRLDQAVENLKRIKANLKRYKATILKAAVEGKLTEQWRKDHPDVEPANELLKKVFKARAQWIENESKSGNNEAGRLINKIRKHHFDIPNDVKLPPTWSWASFITASKIVVDCHNKTAPYERDGIPLVRTTNIRNGKLDLKNIKYVSDSTYDYWSRRCPPIHGDILFTREAPMGEAAIIPKGVKLCMGQRMMLIRLFDQLVSRKYMLYSIMSPNFQIRLQRGAVGTGVKHLRVGDVESLVVPLPPIQEQLEIISCVDTKLSIIEEIDTQVNDSLNCANSIRQSILKKAFSGQLIKSFDEYESGEAHELQMAAETDIPYDVRI